MTKLPNLLIMRKLGFEPDPWQLQVLEGNHRRLLLNCCRQAGKSTVVAVLALLEALTVPGAIILLLSRSQRQSTELFRLTADFFRRLDGPFFKRRIANELEFTTGSRILSLPCNPDAIRGFANVHMLVIDEASRVPDELYRAVRPMLAASNGRLICLSTPNGKHGFFHDAWARGGADWHRIAVRAQEVPRIEASFLEEEQRSLGDSYFRQEYECSFESLQGLVYPDFAKLTTPEPATLATQPAPLAMDRVGGIDFGFRNPFAALWGHLDRDRVLWLTGEHYERLQPLSHHVRFLSKQVRWYADPSGAADIAELQRAGFIVRKGNNELRPGIGAVTSRLRAGGLRILPNACPQLLQEATLYRWSSPGDGDAETPVDEDNHALAALRYLVTRLDEGKLRLPMGAAPPPPGAVGGPPAPTSKWLSVHNEELWTRVY